MTDTALVIEALRARAGQRQRAGALLSQKLAEARAGGHDVRSKALRVVDELAAATSLEEVADALEAGRILLQPPAPAPLQAATIAAVPESFPETVGDDEPATTGEVIDGHDVLLDDDDADADAAAEVDRLLSQIEVDQ